ncbi:MAG: pyruvate dehydrogenase (acetyl-transferring) E1 component subunit alpha [Chloroflexota bacterium]
MPKETIEIPYQVTFLSILDEQGQVDEELAPDIPDELLLKMYRVMLLARRFDERMLNLQRQGRIGTFAPVKGQEASQIGSAAALQQADWLVPSYRDQAASIYHGQSLESYLLVYGGYYQGNRLTEEVRNLPVAVPVGTQTLHAAGLAYAARSRGDDQVVMVYFGDGATSQGDFHEAMNFAGVFQIPLVFICQNNQYAISIPRERQTHAKTLAQKALAYGLPGVQVDGNDVLAVYVAAQEAVARARAGDGATLIECLTYRLSLHTTADDPTRYRSEEEVRAWEKRDPLPRFRSYLKGKGLLSDEKIEAVEKDVRKEIDTTVEQAEARMNELQNEALSMFDHIYAELPPYLAEQRRSLEEALAAEKNAEV